MNISVVSRNIGIALVFNAVFMFLGAITSMIYDFDSAFSPLFLSAVITFTTGLFPLIFVSKYEDINIKEGFTIIVFSWVLSCLFGMLPYVLWGGEFSLINAWYESVSGYTTTGATILTNVEALPKGLLFWRSSTHFLGGIGVVIFMLLILPSVSTFRMRLSKMEISALSKENYKFKTQQTIRVITSVYVGLTIIETFCLLFAGMDFFDAINHAFSTISTGGFSTRNESILAFNSFPIELIITIFMLLSGLHFGLLYSSIVSRSGKIFRSPIIKFYLLTVLVAIICIAFDIKISGKVESWIMAFRQSMFQVASIASTTGFATTNTSVWPNLSILLLLYLSMQCACSGSTTGGIKSDRVYLWWKSVSTQIKKQIHPNAVIPVRVGNHTIEHDMIASVNLYIVLYIFIVFVVGLLLSVMGINFMESFSASIANMGNVGPGFGSIGSLGNYSGFPVMAKFILSIEMLLGRLEIYSLLLIFVIYKWR
ncbi:MAG: TrkH family potassium uptake protein [Bacteroidales bacterium]